jgi:hypothetical protein
MVSRNDPWGRRSAVARLLRYKMVPGMVPARLALTGADQRSMTRAFDRVGQSGGPQAKGPTSSEEVFAFIGRQSPTSGPRR